MMIRADDICWNNLTFKNFEYSPYLAFKHIYLILRIVLNYIIQLILSSQFYFGLFEEDLKLEPFRINTMDWIGFKFRLINRI